MPRPPLSQNTQDVSDIKVAFALALLSLAVYLATIGLHFISYDEIAAFTVARDLAGRGSIDADPIAWLGPPLMGSTPATVIGVDGHSYGIKEPGASFLAVPFVLVGRLTGTSLVHAAFLLSPAVTSITVAMLYLLIRQLGYSEPTAVLGTLAYAVASLAVPYARTLYTQPEAALGLLLALWGVTSARTNNNWRSALWAGVGVGLAGISALPLWITLPIHALFLVPWESLTARPRHLFAKRILYLWTAFGTGAGLLALTQGLYNLARFGSMWQTGHQGIGIVDLNPAYFSVGSVGLLFSTSRGLLWAMPLTLLVPPGIAVAAIQRLRGRPLLLAAGQIAAVFLFYSIFRWWMGGTQFGPRYLVPVAPALVLLIVPWIDRLIASGSWWEWLLSGIVAIVSLATQMLGSLLDFSFGGERISRLYDIPMPWPRFSEAVPILLDVTISPQLWSLRLIKGGHWDVIWLSRGSIDWLTLAPLIGLILLAAGGLFLVLRNSMSRHSWASLAFQALLSLGIVWLILERYPRSSGFLAAEQPEMPGARQLLAALSEQTRQGDAIVLLLYPEESYAWLDLYDGVLPDIGLTLQSTLDHEAMQQLARVERTYDRLWLVSTGTRGGNAENAVEEWIAQRGYAGAEMWFADFRLVPYTFEHQETTLLPIEAQFNDNALELTGYAVEVIGREDGGWLNVRLRWEARRPIPANYTVFVHLRDSQGNVVAQHDGWPVSAYSPTSTWDLQSPVDDRHLVFLPAGLPAGDYPLFVGLYDSATGERVRLADGNDSLLLLLVHIDSRGGF